MTKWSGYKTTLIEALDGVLGTEGFQWLSPWSQFRKTMPRGFINLVLSFSDYDDGVMVEGHCGLRSDAVEETVFKYTRGLRGFEAHSHTLITSLGKLGGKPFERYLVQSDDEARNTAAVLIEAIEERARAFWVEYQELEALDRLFNQHADQPSPLINNRAQSFLRGVTVATLLQKSEFEALVAAHRDRLKASHPNPMVVDGYEALVAQLRGHWVH